MTPDELRSLADEGRIIGPELAERLARLCADWGDTFEQLAEKKYGSGYLAAYRTARAALAKLSGLEP